MNQSGGSSPINEYKFTTKPQEIAFCILFESAVAGLHFCVSYQLFIIFIISVSLTSNVDVYNMQCLS